MFDGVPHEAVRDFRELLEERRIEDGSAANDRVPVDEGRVIETVVFGRGRKVGDPVEPGDELVVQATFEHPTGLSGWIAEVQIDSTLGTPVYRTTSGMTTLGLEPLKERRTLEFVIKDSPFGTGQYFVNVSLQDSSGRHLFDAPQITSFEVPHYSQAEGLVHAVPEVRDLGA